ncbi:MAG: glycosyltransferase [Planctomycetaceae bacterium]
MYPSDEFRSFHAVLKRIPEAKLILVREGELRSKLESMNKDLDIASKVTFTGHLCRDDLKKQLAQARVRTVPSVFAEGHSLCGRTDTVLQETCRLLISANCGLRQTRSGTVISSRRRAFAFLPE